MWLVNLIPSIDTLPLSMLLAGAVLVVIGYGWFLSELLRERSRTV